MNFYQNKTVFITGGSAGIGLAVAKAMAAQGGHVVLFARNHEKLKSAADEIRQRNGRDVRITCYSVDTSLYDAVKSVFDKAVKETAAPDFLINCVGMARPDYFENITPDSFEKTIRTNLYSTWNSAYCVLPYMKRKGGGHIVNTSSIAGFLGVFGYTDYCMTKFGIIGFSDALRQELAGYNINVTVLCPPDTDTPGFAEENRNKPPETQAIGGKAKLLKPEAVADALLKGLRKKKKLIIPGAEGSLTLLMKRFFPSLLEWVIKNSIRKVKKNSG